MSGKLVISIDGMGGDEGPSVVIPGLEAAHLRHPEARFLVFGDEAKLRAALDASPRLRDAVEIRHTADAVAMDDKPSQALRRGRQTSMWLAIDAVRQGLAQAVVSAGNTGALMAMAKFQLRTIAGVERPAIAAIWPTTRSESIVLDVGANTEATDKQLVDFAIMGAEFARAVLNLSRPTVGLLNIGAEELKGNEHVKAAAQALREAHGLSLDFRGFVEGNDIGRGTVDVVVTDGFTGNIALKTAEGTARQIGGYLREAFQRSLMARIGYVFAKGALDMFRAKVDPRRSNGGVFLGLNGLVVKSHGGTDALGFASAVDLAVDMAEGQIVSRIARDVQRLTFGDVEVPAGGREGTA
ncbi:phosphate acyltransferase PlsX [Futiania mangrovi]|uniref:Phosphate acyltransferase n=1 Tax=Futiania mangrovi TaxID=2959716 RepID=A0A9J6PAI5_9PROT|nr:phosphate acyltransferase PlsX [Futiania mangrovii]MCP1336069.1 phosphate acyltransferase PlsX [Futiania mangrovii]